MSGEVVREFNARSSTPTGRRGTIRRSVNVALATSHFVRLRWPALRSANARPRLLAPIIGRASARRVRGQLAGGFFVSFDGREAKTNRNGGDANGASNTTYSNKSCWLEMEARLLSHSQVSVCPRPSLRPPDRHFIINVQPVHYGRRPNEHTGSNKCNGNGNGGDLSQKGVHRIERTLTLVD